MNKGQHAVLCLLFCVFLPAFAWFFVASRWYELAPDNIDTLAWPLIQYSAHFYPQAWPLWVTPIVAALLGLAFSVAVIRGNRQVFAGARFHKFLRGTRMASQSTLARKTRERGKQQVTIAGVPVPTRSETAHFSIGGRTGAGKTTVLKEMMLAALKRGDRMIVLDSDGEFVRTFYRPGDHILNPYDQRSEHWNFFNEIRHDYDYERYAKSVVQVSSSSESEEWNDYGRTLFREVARKIAATTRRPTMDQVYEWTNRRDVEELAEFCRGTDAEGIFSGHDRATTSVRFVLSNKLVSHLKMPPGEFSLNDWVNDPNGGNLFITWNEQMKEALTPLISCWMDTLLDQIIALPSSRSRRIWAFLDELESLGQLPTIHKAITRGRKKGLRVVVGYQSYSQLVSIYGQQMATTMLSSLSTTVALATTRAGTDTAEHMSKALGEHEVKRDKSGRSHRFGEMATRSTHQQTDRERIVMPSEISGLDDNRGFLAFPGSLPVAPIAFEPVNYRRATPVQAFEPIDAL